MKEKMKYIKDVSCRKHIPLYQSCNRIYSCLLGLGVDPLRFFRTVKDYCAFLIDQRRFARMGGFSDVFQKGATFPCMRDRGDSAGVTNGDYFNQDLLVAQRIFLNNPQLHIDVGSRVDGFVAHVASFRKIEVLDIRPLKNSLDNITFRQCDFMGELPESLRGQYDSVSSLHAIEHFGLGRYGDPMDPDGWRKGIDNLRRLLKPGGKLYFSVPIGPMRIEYNAHRVFSVGFLKDLLDQTYKIDMFSYVDDQGILHKDVSLNDETSMANSFGCVFGCGIFELTLR